MNKDEIQSTKALTKMNCIKKVIEILQNLNLLENSADMKQYNIVLDYIKNDNSMDDNENFTTFKVTVYSSRLYVGQSKETKMFDFNFKLKDEDTGFAIFKNIREYFLEKNDLQYSCFQSSHNFDNLKYTEHTIYTNHNVHLTSMIHSKKDEMKLEKFQEKICKKYGRFVKTINTSNLSKDEIQILKAKQKSNITFAIIDTLNKLEECDISRSHVYDIVLDYKEYKNEDFIVFKIKLLKNRANEIFNMNFKLKDKNIGIDLFDKISRYFVEVNRNSMKYFANSSYKETDLENSKHVISAYNSNLICRMPQQKFDNLCKDFSNTLPSPKINVKTK